MIVFFIQQKIIFRKILLVLLSIEKLSMLEVAIIFTYFYETFYCIPDEIIKNL